MTMDGPDVGTQDTAGGLGCIAIGRWYGRNVRDLGAKCACVVLTIDETEMIGTVGSGDANDAGTLDEGRRVVVSSGVKSGDGRGACER